MRIPLIRTLSVTWLVAVTAMFGCADSSPPGRVLVIGIDAANLLIAKPMLEEGRLPHLAGLAKDGASGPLGSLYPYVSPRVWTTIATGKDAPKHGIFGFVREDGKGGRHLYLSSDRSGAAIWNIFSHYDRSVAIVNWWTSFPPEEVNGVLVSDHVFADEIEKLTTFWKADTERGGATVFPPEIEAVVREIASTDEALVDFANPFESEQGFPGFVPVEPLSRVFKRDAEIVRVALHLEETNSPDLTMVFLPGIDRVSHRLWGTLRPEDLYPAEMKHPEWARKLNQRYQDAYKERPPIPEEERAHGAEAVRKYYEYTDLLIGELLKRYGPDDLVLVVSDHGFEWAASYGVLTGAHETLAAHNGLIFARGPGIPPGSIAKDVGVADVTPTILAWSGLAQARDMDGKPMAFLASGEQPDPVNSYDHIEITRLPSGPSGLESDIQEELRSLGYID